MAMLVITRGYTSAQVPIDGHPSQAQHHSGNGIVGVEGRVRKGDGLDADQDQEPGCCRSWMGYNYQMELFLQKILYIYIHIYIHMCIYIYISTINIMNGITVKLSFCGS